MTHGKTEIVSTVPTCIEKCTPLATLGWSHAHVSLGDMEKQWKMFTRQMIRTHQLLPSLFHGNRAALTQMVSGPEAEINNLNSIYTSYQPLIQAATQLLKKEPSFDRIPVSSNCIKRSLLPFLGDALSWLTGTAMTEDINAIKTRINKLITTQQSQQETIVQVISILNVTTYATQVNRQHINILMDTTERMHQDIATLYNITALSLQQLELSSNYTPHPIHLGQPLGFTTLYVRSCHIYHGLYWCCWLQEYSHHMYYPLKIWGRCWNTLRKYFLPPCTYQFHWKTPYISTDIYVPTCPYCIWTIHIIDQM